MNRPKYTDYADYAEYAEYAEYAQYAKFAKQTNQTKPTKPNKYIKIKGTQNIAFHKVQNYFWALASAYSCLSDVNQ